MASQAYREQIYKNGRKTVVDISYSLTAPDSKDGGALIVPLANEFSSVTQIMNENRIMSAPVATLEPDYWVLDGTFILPVPPTDNIEVGWWSDAMSDENGYFSTPIIIERTFEQVQSFNQVLITFDYLTDNYCSEFKIDLIDINGGIIYSENIANNTQAIRATAQGGENIYKVRITLYRTNNPFRYARIIEIDFGMVLYYTNDDIKSLTAIREVDYLGKSFIVPQFDLSILNQGDYNVIDRYTYAPYFQTRQRFSYRHGLILNDKTIEWMYCGTFFLENWTVTDKTVTFKAVGKTAQLQKTVYFESSFGVFTIQQLVNRIFTNVRITLQSPRITGYFGEIDLRKILAFLSELSCCFVYEDENNMIRFDDILGINEETAIPDDILDYKNILRTPKIELAEYYNCINLTEYIMSTEYRQVSNTEQTAGEITIFFDNPIRGDGEYEITPGFSLANIIWYTNRMTAILIGAGICIITVRGEAVILAKEENLYNAPWHTGKEPDAPYPINIPCMIKNSEGYAEFRVWFLQRKFKMLEKRMNSNLFWKNNPERRIGDIVQTQINQKGNNVNFYIARQELTFAGALKGNTKIISPIVFMQNKWNDDEIWDDSKIWRD